MYGASQANRSYGVQKREITPWFTSNSEYGRQVRENIERRLLQKNELLTARQISRQADPPKPPRSSTVKSRSSLASRPLSSRGISPPIRSRASPVRLSTREKQQLKDQSALHLSLPPFLGQQRLPPLEASSTSTNYTFRMESHCDPRRRSLEGNYYKRRNPPSGLGKRYMLSECPRLWSNMGKLTLPTSPTPSVDVLTIEHQADFTDPDSEDKSADDNVKELRAQ